MGMERYYWLKEHKICTTCGHEDAFEGHTRCPKCIEKASIASAKCWDKKRAEYNKRGLKRKKELRSERKEQHLCTRCGKPLPINQKEFECITCRKKRNEKRRTGREVGEKFRERIEQEKCMYCGETAVKGYCFCEAHLKELRERKSCANKGGSERWRKEIEGQWKSIK